MPKIIKKTANLKTAKSTKPTKSIAQPKPKITGPTPNPKLSTGLVKTPKPIENPKSVGSASKTPTKQAQIIALLSGAQGTKLEDLMQATGWQAHSVRGFLSGTIKKKLGLHLISQKRDGVQIYQIAIK